MDLTRVATNTTKVAEGVQRRATDDRVRRVDNIRAMLVLAWNGKNGAGVSLVILGATVLTVIHQVVP
jgi:hypothetical protein